MTSNIISAPIYAISPHRFCTDGFGVTTLVAFYGCPLRCKWCINPKSQLIPEGARRLTAQELHDKVKHDDILFRATSGGITFGGGEPCLYPEFIAQFAQICSPDWNLRIETSLNVPTDNVLSLIPIIDEWLVDIKLWDAEKYKDYTGKENDLVLHNLQHLLPIQEKVVVRIPIIEGVCDENEAKETERLIYQIGFKDIQIYHYTDPKEIFVNRKWDCLAVRKVRLEIAKQNGIEVDDPECQNSFCETGTCEHCEAVLKEMEIKLNDLGVESVKLDRLSRARNRFGLVFDPNLGEFFSFQRYKLCSDEHDFDGFSQDVIVSFSRGGFA